MGPITTAILVGVTVEFIVAIGVGLAFLPLMISMENYLSGSWILFPSIRLAELGDAPYYATILWSDIPVCGGTLIDPYHVLTSAFCVYNEANTTSPLITVALGSEVRPGDEIFSVRLTYIHEGYKVGKVASSLAMLTLTTAAYPFDNINKYENIRRVNFSFNVMQSALSALTNWQEPVVIGYNHEDRKPIHLKIYNIKRVAFNESCRPFPVSEEVHWPNDAYNMRDVGPYTSVWCAAIVPGNSGCHINPGDPVVVAYQTHVIAGFVVGPPEEGCRPTIFTFVPDYITLVKSESRERTKESKKIG